MKFPHRTREIEYAHDHTIEVQMLETLLRIEELLTPKDAPMAFSDPQVSKSYQQEVGVKPVAKKKAFRL